jgi:hypothetical protein|tara:strand:- start:87 stop:269 length:183 start_codon:yes stop_codon:yes gene_type:complete
MVTGLLLDTIPIEDVATVILRVWLLQLLLSSEHMFTKRLDNVLFVVVAGLFLMDMVDKML